MTGGRFHGFAVQQDGTALSNFGALVEALAQVLPRIATHRLYRIEGFIDKYLFKNLAHERRNDGASYVISPWAIEGATHPLSSFQSSVSVGGINGNT